MSGDIKPRELTARFQDSESQLVERKRDAKSSLDHIRQAICAFSNDLPNTGQVGVIFIGQNDDGSCANLEISDQLLLQLSGLRTEGKILPIPILSVTKECIGGCALAVIQVTPLASPPARLDGQIWIRVGPRRALASPEEERLLSEKQVSRGLSFDAFSCRHASINDLDLVRFELEYLPNAISRQTLRENGRSVKDKLRGLRFIDQDSNPTHAAILLFGIVPTDYLPGDYIQFLRVDGEKITEEIIDQREIHGPLGDQIRQIEDLIRINPQTRTRITGLKREEYIEYPFEALQQIIRNAVLHRNYDSNTPIRLTLYSDRIEILSPGGLYGEVMPETIWQGVTAYQNPRVAEGMKILGFVERFGFGMRKIQDALAENGNPLIEARFEINYTHFVVKKKPRK